MNKNVDLDFLIQAAGWQDSLLQSYRSLHLTFQSIMLAIGIGLLIASISFDLGIQSLIADLVLVAVWILQIYVTRRMQEIIFNRGEDVNFWHRRIICTEQTLPPQQRAFTNFKIDQQARRKDVAHLKNMFLSDNIIDNDQTDLLIEKGLGHTRHIVDDNLFRAISWLWVLLVIGSIAFDAYRLAGNLHLV